MEHPLVVGYLARYDTAAAGLSATRRGSLREELVDHLHTALSDSADDAEIASVVAALGAPVDLVAHERDSSAPSERRNVDAVRVVYIVAACLLAIPVVFSVLGLGVLVASGSLIGGGIYIAEALSIAAIAALIVAARRRRPRRG